MRFAALVSGNGTNLQAILDAQATGSLAPAEVACVLSNRSDAFALERARRAGVPCEILDHRHYPSREVYDRALLETLAEHRVEAVVLAGFMRILSPVFIEAFPARVLNTHPALCPAFPGTHAAQQAIDYGVRVTGCTVHLVDTGVDTGPIVFQAAVEVRPDDTPESLQARIQVHEHRLLPEAMSLLAQGRITVEGRRVTLR